LLNLAFSSILIDVSKLKRSPCLGYSKEKKIDSHAPFVLMNQKIYQIIEDLKIIKNEYSDYLLTPGKVFLANAIE